MAQSFGHHGKRLAAWLVCLSLVFAQLALPLTANAADVTLRPMLTVWYQDANGIAAAVQTTGDIVDEAPVYWVTLPEAAFFSPISIEVTGVTNDPALTYDPAPGTPVSQVNASSIDNTSMVATVNTYLNGQLIACYPIYLSSIPLPSGSPVSVKVMYADASGSLLIDDIKTLSPGIYTLTPELNADMESMGYTLQGASSVEVTVNADGSYWPNPVTFTYNKNQPVQQDAQVQVIYADASGTTLLSDVKTYAPGYYTLGPERGAEVEAMGYILQSEAYIDVTVNNDGTYWPNPVMFTYAQNQPTPQDAQVQIVYADTAGSTLLSDVKQLAPGYYTLTPERGAEVEAMGYVLQGSSNADVTVNSDGTYWPSPVMFTYAQNQPTPQDAQVQIVYADTAGSTLLSDVKRLAPGYYSLTPERGAEVEAMGYAPQSVAPVDVTVNSDGTYWPSPVMFTYAKNQPVQQDVDVRIVYTDAAGTTLLSGTKRLSPGTHTLAAERGAEVEAMGYTLQSAPTADVTVYNDGTYWPNPVQFTYVQTSYPITPVNREGKVIKAVNMRSSPSTANSANIVFPTVAVGSEVWVSGTTTAENRIWLSIRYQNRDCYAIADNIDYSYVVDPIAASVNISYLDQNGNAVSPASAQTLQPGVYDTSAFAIPVPSGCTYQGVNAAQITVDAKGIATPSSVVFTYVSASSVTGELIVRYLDTEGNEVAPTVTRTLSPGKYSATTFAIPTPQGYTYKSVSTQEITVGADGSVKPVSVNFTYEGHTEPSVTATVAFFYITADGAQVADTLYMELEEGVHKTQEYAIEPGGYTLISTTTDTINVSANGIALPAQVTYTYAKNKTGAQVKVHYADALGQDFVGSPQIVDLEVGTNSVKPNSSYVPAGYTLSAGCAASQTIVVSPDFVATPSEIWFSYYNSSITANLVVHYVDASTGRDITTETIKLAPGEHEITPNAAMISSAYQLSDASATSYAVTVSESGVISSPQVSFYYQPTAAEMYMGYAVTITQAPLHLPVNTVIDSLPANTLLYINGQQTSGGILWSSSQTVLGASRSGFVQDNMTRHITLAQAQAIIDAYQQSTEPTQSSGYYITIGTGVPMRSIPDAYANVIGSLAINTVVYVSGQVYRDGTGWHISTYDSHTGYIRVDQLRKMSEAEVQAYLTNHNTTAPQNTATPAPYDPYGKSSYGYVTSSSVNFRQTPSVSGAKIKTLRQYAMSFVIGTRVVNGVTWYNVNQSGTVGWIHGDYYHHMNLTEFNNFLNSPEYQQGVLNNSASASSSSSSSNTSGSSSQTSGSATAGDVTAMEDYNLGVWQSTGGTAASPSYEPYNPYATPYATATPAPTQSTAPDATGAQGTLSPEATAEGVAPTQSAMVIGTMIPITYGDESLETQTNVIPWGLIIAGIVLLGAAGGIYAYALSQNKKRKAAAARAAAKRQQNGGGRNGGPGGPGGPGGTGTGVGGGYGGAGGYSSGSGSAGGYSARNASQYPSSPYTRGTSGTSAGMYSQSPTQGAGHTGYGTQPAKPVGYGMPQANPPYGYTNGQPRRDSTAGHPGYEDATRPTVPYSGTQTNPYARSIPTSGRGVNNASAPASQDTNARSRRYRGENEGDASQM